MGNLISHCVVGFRDKTRQIWRRRSTDLLSLPPKLLHSILKEVGEKSFGDLCRSKSICSTLRYLADNELFIRDLDLVGMQTPYAHLIGRNFFNLCLETGNPSALFIQGAWDFFKRNQMEERILRIWLAAERRYPLSLYAYANLSRIMNLGNDLRCDLSRDFIKKARIRVGKAPDLAWPSYPLPPYWTEKIKMIPVYELYDCRCCTNRSWEYPWDERSKNGNMCDSYFWTVQTLWFSRKFSKKVMNWPEENQFEDHNWPTEYLMVMEDLNRPAYCIKFLVLCVLLFVACFLVLLV